jgi:hypothetical protein
MTDQDDRQVDIPKIDVSELRSMTPSEQEGGGALQNAGLRDQVVPFGEREVELPTVDTRSVDIPDLNQYQIYKQKAFVARTQAVDLAGPFIWKGSGWDQYDMEDWLAAFARKSRMESDAQMMGDAIRNADLLPNGLPADWDYLTAETGPFGEPLPGNAEGWNPLGQPDYGTGVGAWWKQQWAKVVNIPTYEDLVEDIPEQYVGGAQVKQIQNQLWSEGKIGEWLKYNAGLGIAAMKHALGRRQADGRDQLSAGQAISGFTRHIVLEGLMEGLNQLAVGTERLVGPRAVALAEMTDRAAADGSVMWTDWMDDPGADIPLIGFATRPIGRLISGAAKMWIGQILVYTKKGGMQEFRDLKREYRQMEDTDWKILGSRISYTLIRDQVARENYKQRIREGEAPHLVAMELYNPEAELIGRLLGDPLNFLEGPLAAIKANRAMRTARAITSTPIDEFATVADDINDIQNLANPQLVQARNTELAEKVIAGVDNIRNGLIEEGTRRGLFHRAERAIPGLLGQRTRIAKTLTASGKQATYMRRIGGHLNVILDAVGGKADKMFEYMHSMALMASKDPDDVLQGLHALGESGVNLNVAFSQTGMEAAVAMREMLFNPSTGKFKTVGQMFGKAESFDDIFKAVNSGTTNALKRVFPTLDDQIKQHDELAKLLDDFGEGSDEVVQYLQKNPQAAKDISRGQRMMLEMDRRAQVIYRPVNRIFSTIYLKWRPAYAMRNHLTNTFHVTVDAGVGAGIKTFFGKYTMQGSVDEIRRMLGFVPEQAVLGLSQKAGIRGLEEAFEKGGAWNWSKVSQDLETMASVQIYAKSVRDTMTKGLVEGAAIPRRNLLTGFTDDEADLLMGLAKRHNGNLAAMQDDIRRLAGEEGVSAARNLLFMDDAAIKKFQDLGIYDEAVRIGTQADDLAHAEEMIDAAKTAWADDAAKAGRESGHLAEPTNAVEQAEFEDVASLEKGLEQAGVANAADQGDLLSRQVLADRKALDAQEKVLGQMEDDLLMDHYEMLNADRQAGRITVEEQKRLASQYKDEFVGDVRVQTEQVTQDTVQQANHLREGTWAANDKSYGIGRRPKGSARDEMFKKAWQETGLPQQADDFFVDMTPRKFRRSLWGSDNYFATRNSLWIDRREQIYALNNGLMQRIGAATGMSPGGIAKKSMEAYESMATARLWQRAEILDDGSAIVQLTGSELREVFVENYQMMAGLNAVQDADAAGRVKAMADNMVAYMDRIRARPDRNMEYAFNNLDTEAQRALEMMVGPDKQKQYEVLEMAIYDSRFRFVDVAGVGERQIVGEGINELSVGMSTLADAPILYNIDTVPGTGEDALNHWLRDLHAEGHTEFVTTAQFDDILDEAGEVVQRRGAGFFERMEEKGYITYVEDYVSPGGLSDTPGKRYTINSDALQPEARTYDHVMPPAAEPGPFHTPARNAYETQPTVEAAFEELRLGLRENWGDLRNVTLSPEMERSSQAWLGELNKRTTELKATAVEVADQKRNFALLDYRERGFVDNLLGYIYPYHFWYAGTYKNWLSRAFWNPAVVNRYKQYRNFLEHTNAGMPEWWRYNINVSRALGIETENPLFFNLEASLNPLHGVMGTDFDDPQRRATWYGKLADDLGRFGPTIWTPYAWAAGAAMHIQGKEDAATKWFGRAVPITQDIRNLTALMGINKGLGVELDPMILLAGGGIGPYERPRVGRMLTAFVEEERYPEAAIIDAAYTQSGPIWDEARAAAIHQRSPNLASVAAPFFLGVGFKPRSQTDIEIDRFNTERFALMSSKAMMSPEEYREAWAELEEKFPFMEAALMAKKSGQERDEAFAWNVLGRIPPGMTDEIAELVGIKAEDITNFYETKGDIPSMSEPDQLRFMAAMLDIAGFLDLPDGATRREWEGAKSEFRDMKSAAEELFGEDIWEKIDVFYGKPDDQKDAYIKANPDVQAALNWKDATVITNPVLAPYYTSIDRIEKYLNRQMYEAIEDELGEDIWDKWEVYHRLKDMKASDARKYYKATPELKRYGEIKDEWGPQVGAALIRLSEMIPEARPPAFRDGAPTELLEPDFAATGDNEAWIRQQVLQFSSGIERAEIPPLPPQLPIEQLLSRPGGATLLRLIMDTNQDQELPLPAVSLLEDMGIDSEIIGLIAESGSP